MASVAGTSSAVARSTGPAAADRRATINGILWRLRPRAPWRDVPERYGNWNSIARCFRRWCQNGTWEAADCSSYETLIDLPESPPEAMLADKGYDSDAIRADLKARGIRLVIPLRANRKATVRWDKRLYRQRNRIERMIGHLKFNRAIATRYDKLAESFLGMLHLAAIKYWLKFVHTT